MDIKQLCKYFNKEDITIRKEENGIDREVYNSRLHI